MRIVILGAGISGLSLAWFLKQRFGEGLSLILLEKSSRPGGWIRTVAEDGFLFETGPRSCRTRGAGVETLRLIEGLGLQDEVITADPATTKSYIYRKNDLVPLPYNLIQAIFSPFAKILLAALWRDWRAPRGAAEDTSIEEFITRRLGAQVAEQLIDPMTSGIYAGEIKRLSIQACFPTFYEWEQKHGSLMRGAMAGSARQNGADTQFQRRILKHSIFSLREGMEALPKALAANLVNELHLDTAARAVRFEEGQVLIEDTNGEVLKADHLFSSVSWNEMRRLLGDASRLVDPIPYASVAVVSLGYKSQVLTRKGFGYLIPSSEKEETLGVVWDSCIFPQQNQWADETRLTVMIGGSRMRDFESRSKDDFQSLALQVVAKHLGITQIPDAMHVTLAKGCLPQYLVGHPLHVQRVEKQLRDLSPRMTCLGSSYYGAAVNDCIAKAREVALKFGKR